MPTLAELWNIADKPDRVCLILLEEPENEARIAIIAAVLEVTDATIVVGDGGETEFFTTTFSWKGMPIDDGRLKTKRIPPSELERLDECRLQGLYPAGRMPVKKYPPAERNPS